MNKIHSHSVFCWAPITGSKDIFQASTYENQIFEQLSFAMTFNVLYAQNTHC